MKNNFILILIFIGSCGLLYAQKNQNFSLASPDGNILVSIETGTKLKWSVKYGQAQIISPSVISMKLQDGLVMGEMTKVASSTIENVDKKIDALNYKKAVIIDQYKQLSISFKGDYGVIFRAYNDGVAYRFYSKKKGEITILSEEANFNFEKDELAYIPYANTPVKDKYQCSFENFYQHINLSKIDSAKVAFAPLLVDFSNGMKAAITEADLEDYPGMFLKAGNQNFSLAGDFAAYPVEEIQGGHNNLQSIVTKRTDYLAKTSGNRNFPWRVIILSKQDKDLLNNDMVYKLASASRVADVSWVKPGKVAWDWWNDWNISKVDFRAGINTATYKYYIDFASANKIENIMLDEGWANSLDIMQIIPEINLQEIVDYGKQKNVGVWLWGGWLPLDKKTDLAFSTYSKMGIKGFKIDFMNRDDQKMVNFYYRLAQKAAEYKLMLDFHGAYKPTGMQRTYPNVLNFEGVRGMENVKWSNPDFPLYDCTIPFIRMIAGPMDYTPGAMLNANKTNFRIVYSAPMSQGTRCHQLAMYVLYESPFAMLSDNPTNYMKEQESTTFIASIPTIFDETIALDGKVAEYAVIVRRNKDNWYVGVLNNWDARDIMVDFSFLHNGNFEAEVFKDGINADREGSDYKREIIQVNSTTKLNIHLSNGGGWVARIYPVK